MTWHRFMDNAGVIAVFYLAGICIAGAVEVGCPIPNGTNAVSGDTGTISSSSVALGDGGTCEWTLAPEETPHNWLLMITVVKRNFTRTEGSCEVYVNGLPQCGQAGEELRVYCERGSACGDIMSCEEIEGGSFPLRILYSPQLESWNETSAIRVHFAFNECDQHMTDFEIGSATPPDPSHVGDTGEEEIAASTITTQLMPVLVIAIIVLVGVGVVFKLRRKNLKIMKKSAERRKSIRESVRRKPYEKPASSVYLTANEEASKSNNNLPKGGVENDDTPTDNSSSSLSNGITDDLSTNDCSSSNIDWQTLYKKNRKAKHGNRPRKGAAKHCRHGHRPSKASNASNVST